MPDTNDFYISLAAANSRSQPIPCNGDVRASVGISPRSAYEWGSAIVEVEYSIDPDSDRWHSFPTPLTMTTSSPAVTRIATAGLLAIRLRTTTPDGESDPAAPFDVTLTDATGRTRTPPRV